MARGALVVLIAACAGNQDEAPDTTATGETGADAPTFGVIRDDLLRPTCALIGCHASAASGNGLALPQGEEYAAIVEAAAVLAPGEVFVIPGDPDGSYILRKVTGAPGIVGDPMPPPFGNIDPRLVEQLRLWIEAGALDN